MNVKHGFSTLNRFLGKKNKDKNLSKSSMNLSVSTNSNNHLDTTSLSSHLHTQNRITPLPTATSNAPFEQTFRITVLLPQNQLYVARLGAKIKLDKLLQLVCENKQLDSEIYEFRHPIDSSQVFNLELTIGSVGLTEIRLCHKSETYDNFNADEIIKLRHQTIGRDSLSSSEFSSRHSKNTKTASPYSSTNSLNSIDSTGMNTNYRGPLSLPTPTHHQHHQQSKQQQHKQPPMPPARKKRMAPRPPIQNCIPEKDVVNNVQVTSTETVALPRKNQYVSTPNLTTNHQIYNISLEKQSPPIDFHQSNHSIDCNGNSKTNPDQNYLQENQPIIEYPKQRPQSMLILNREFSTESTDSANVNNVVEIMNEHVKIPEPSPRHAIINNIKKKVNAPAPPPRTLTAIPVATPRISTNLQTDDTQTQNPQQIHEPAKDSNQHNVSKVMLNQSTDQLNSSQHSDSGIGELEPPIIKSSSLQTEENLLAQTDANCNESIKSIFAISSSSDDEEHIKVYNLRLGKTIQQQQQSTNFIDTKNQIAIAIESNQSLDMKEVSARSNSPNWTYTIPAPPKFADLDEQSSPSSVQSESSSTESACDDNIHHIYNNQHESATQKSNISEFERNSNNLAEIVNQTLINEHEIFQKCKPQIKNHQNNSTILINSDTEDGYHGNNRPTTPDYIEQQLNTKNLAKTRSYDQQTVIPANHLVVEDLKIITKSKSDVILELQNVIDEKKSAQETIKRTETQDADSDDGDQGDQGDRGDEIESAGPCNLSNFKISTYSVSPPNSPLKTVPDKSNLKLELTSSEAVRTNIQTNNNAKSPITPITPTFQPSTPKASALQEVGTSNSPIQQPPVQSSTPKSPIHKNEPGSPLNSPIIHTNAPDSPLNSPIRKKAPDSPPKSPIHTNEPSSSRKSSITTTINEFSTIKQETGQNTPTILIEQPKRSNDSITTTAAVTPTSDVDDEKLYRKRSITSANTKNIPIQTKSRRSVNRSDSFHSTVRPSPDLLSATSSELITTIAPTSRSSSFLSLIAAQKQEQSNQFKANNLTDKYLDTNRIKSASELSIGESPSLQSLIVMKSILNLKKSNTNHNEPISSTTASLVQQRQQNELLENEQQANIDEFVSKSAIIDEISQPKNDDSLNQNEKLDDQPEKKWKYQGPPSINLSTWNERPKLQTVTIKNEGDYICGGNNNIKSTTSICTMPRNYRNSLPATAQLSIQQYNQSANKANAVKKSEQLPSKVPFVRSVEYKKMNSPISNNSFTKLAPETDEHILKGFTVGSAVTATGATAMTLGRFNKFNRHSIQVTPTPTPTVKGFQSLDYEKTTKSSSEAAGAGVGVGAGAPPVWKTKINNGTPTNLRYSDLGAQYTNNIDDQLVFNKTRKSLENCTGNLPAFTQIQLRKTGLKEKIYANPNILIPNNCNNKDIVEQPLLLSTTKHLQITQKSSPNQKLANPSTDTCANQDSFKKTNKSVENVRKTQEMPLLSAVAAPVAPSPPPPPIIRSVVTKQNSNGTTVMPSSCEIDPRNQLFAAIRNFNKDQLLTNKKSI